MPKSGIQVNGTAAGVSSFMTGTTFTFNTPLAALAGGRIAVLPQTQSRRVFVMNTIACQGIGADSIISEGRAAISYEKPYS
jgi:hypothetical protein